MRPLRLTMEYFGPFMKETIDFSSISKSQLFLISGKTGSGKTMIFDAMVYALFGKTSTASREEVDLRSHFSDPNYPTKVEFEFEIKNNIYHIMRTPKYIKKGNKNPTNPTIEIHQRVNDEWKLIESTINASNDYIKSLLHMNVKQFRQILILPQGEFKQFLVSNSNDKRTILKTLFNSERFEELQESLNEEMKKEILLIEKHYQNIAQLLLELHDFDSDTLKTYKAMEGHRYKKVIENWDAFEEIGTNQLNDVIQLQDDKATIVSGIEKKYEKEKQLLENFEELNEKEASLNKLKEKKSKIDEKKEKLKHLSSVQRIAYQYEQYKEKQKSLIDVNKQYEKIQHNIELNQVQYDELNQALFSVKQNSERIQQYENYKENCAHIYSNLNKYKNAYLERPNKMKLLYQVNEKLESDKAKQKTLKNELNTFNFDESIEDTLLKEQESLKLKVQQLKYEQNQYDMKKVQIEKKEEQSHTLAQLKCEKEETENLLSNKQHFEVLSVENEILKIQNHVHKGDACPICGSTINKINNSIDFEKLKKEQQAIDTLQRDLQQINNKVFAIKERISFIDEQLEMMSNVEDVQEEIVLRESELQQLIGKIEKQRDDKKQLQQLQTNMDNLEKEITSSEIDIIHLNNEVDNFKNEMIYFYDITGVEDVNVFEATYEKQLQEMTEYHKKINEIENKINHKIKEKQNNEMALVSVNERTKMLQSEVASLHTRIEEEMELKKIASYEELDNLLNQLSTIDVLEEEIKAYDNEKIELDAMITSLKQKIGDQKMPEINQTLEELSKTKEKLNEITKEKNQLQLKIEQNTNKMHAINKIVEKIDNDLQEQEEMIELSRVMNGKNGEKLSLENYVLIYYLNHILDNANRHFIKMTNSRYQLVRKKEKSIGLSGLEIEVFDRFSNRARHITSLSGGETFQASLSLAIGLSNVVQQEAGAIHLESIFIDEGFGTLDAETLETALDTLVNIQMSGRLVGIISHVSELKARIPTILNVNKNGFLSTTSFSTN